MPGVGPRLLALGVLVVLASAFVLFGASEPVSGRAPPTAPVPAEAP